MEQYYWHNEYGNREIVKISEGWVYWFWNGFRWIKDDRISKLHEKGHLHILKEKPPDVD
jgi:hypothetical protein